MSTAWRLWTWLRRRREARRALDYLLLAYIADLQPTGDQPRKPNVFPTRPQGES